SPLWQNAALRTRLGLEIGGGNFDELTVPGINDYEASLAAAGIRFTDARLDAGHEWYTWRQLLDDYATTVAFRHTTTSVRTGAARWRHPRREELVATVSGDTTEVVAPAGTVQFYVDGQKAGRPRPVERGVAFLPLPRGGSSASAVYSGDNYYNGSTSPSVSVP
ncbi:MAG TPA: Ig-like domain-containing protein, partial [Solirubrobacteraceae bacterium]|nr:Ig-like domain-containing protein [Solirubrobacteraceae bacterium]